MIDPSLFLEHIEKQVNNFRKVHNVHLGSCGKLDAEAALQKARKMKAEALGISPSE